jgi:hypothetical protein
MWKSQPKTNPLPDTGRGKIQSLSPKRKLQCTHKSLRVAPQAFDPPNPLKKEGAKTSQSPPIYRRI